MGFLGAAIGSGFVLGPAIGGLLGGRGNGPVHQVPFLVAAFFSFIAVCLAMRLKLQSVTSATDSAAASGRQGFFRLLKSMLSSPIGLFALTFFCLNLAFAQVEASYVLLVRDLLDFGPRQTGWLFTYIGVCIIILQGGLIGKLTRAFGEMRVGSCRRWRIGGRPACNHHHCGRGQPFWNFLVFGDIGFYQFRLCRFCAH